MKKGRRRRRRNPGSELVPFVLGATGLIVVLYLAKKLGR